MASSSATSSAMVKLTPAELMKQKLSNAIKVRQDQTIYKTAVLKVYEDCIASGCRKNIKNVLLLTELVDKFYVNFGTALLSGNCKSTMEALKKSLFQAVTDAGKSTELGPRTRNLEKAGAEADLKEFIESSYSLALLTSEHITSYLEADDKRTLENFSKSQEIVATKRSKLDKIRRKYNALPAGIKDGQHTFGTVVNTNERFGFIQLTEGFNLYFSASSLKTPVSIGSTVEFDIGSNKVGPCALNVVFRQQ